MGWRQVNQYESLKYDVSRIYKGHQVKHSSVDSGASFLQGGGIQAEHRRHAKRIADVSFSVYRNKAILLCMPHADLQA